MFDKVSEGQKHFELGRVHKRCLQCDTGRLVINFESYTNYSPSLVLFRRLRSIYLHYIDELIDCF